MTLSDKLPTINLGIGGIIVTRDPCVISTVLGSCVSVCLHDPSTGWAGMNHYMLPFAMNGKMDNIGRFGRTSVPELIRQIKASGANLGKMTARVFGGGQVLASFSSFHHISGNNVTEAFEQLKAAGIQVVGKDVGGERGRKVFFNTEAGSVLVREVSNRTSL